MLSTAGRLLIDNELHLTPIAAEEEDPRLAKLRVALDRRIDEAQLPELLLAVFRFAIDKYADRLMPSAAAIAAPSRPV